MTRNVNYLRTKEIIFPDIEEDMKKIFLKTKLLDTDANEESIKVFCS